MMKVLQSLQCRKGLVLTLALATGILAYTAPVGIASAEQNARGNPCDVRDACSADPGKYAAHRENANVKAREYVGEMRWGTGGAPDDVYVISRTVGSRDFSGAKPCEVRDACGGGQQAWKTVRSGPSVHEAPPVAGDEGPVLSKASPQQ